MPVENSKNTRPSGESLQPREKPPGDYVSDELAEQTKRFVEQAKGLAQRRRKAAEKMSDGPPPPAPDARQRSRRR